MAIILTPAEWRRRVEGHSYQFDAKLPEEDLEGLDEAEKARIREIRARPLAPMKIPEEEYRAILQESLAMLEWLRHGGIGPDEDDQDDAEDPDQAGF